MIDYKIKYRDGISKIILEDKYWGLGEVGSFSEKYLLEILLKLESILSGKKDDYSFEGEILEIEYFKKRIYIKVAGKNIDHEFSLDHIYQFLLAIYGLKIIEQEIIKLK